MSTVYKVRTVDTQSGNAEIKIPLCVIKLEDFEDYSNDNILHFFSEMFEESINDDEWIEIC